MAAMMIRRKIWLYEGGLISKTFFTLLPPTLKKKYYCSKAEQTLLKARYINRSPEVTSTTFEMNAIRLKTLLWVPIQKDRHFLTNALVDVDKKLKIYCEKRLLSSKWIKFCIFVASLKNFLFALAKHYVYEVKLTLKISMIYKLSY